MTNAVITFDPHVFGSKAKALRKVLADRLPSMIKDTIEGIDDSAELEKETIMVEFAKFGRQDVNVPALSVVVYIASGESFDTRKADILSDLDEEIRGLNEFRNWMPHATSIEVQPTHGTGIVRGPSGVKILDW